MLYVCCVIIPLEYVITSPSGLLSWSYIYSQIPTKQVTRQSFSLLNPLSFLRQVGNSTCILVELMGTPVRYNSMLSSFVKIHISISSLSAKHPWHAPKQDRPEQLPLFLSEKGKKYPWYLQDSCVLCVCVFVCFVYFFPVKNEKTKPPCTTTFSYKATANHVING